jgi:hypothetical protein
MGKRNDVIALAILHTVAVVAIGYVLLGVVGAGLFTLGFLGGLIVWLALPERATFADIRTPFWITLGLFVLHKIEERELDFFPALSELTDIPVPEAGSPLAILLYALAAAWLLVPLLTPRGFSFAHYLAWSFFTSMGVIELAHFAFPFFRDDPFGYFPGMASVVLLAPAAWWGLFRMASPPATNGPDGAA